MTKELSNCCHTPISTHSADEGTCYYTCTKCKKACDVSGSEEHDALYKAFAEVTRDNEKDWEERNWDSSEGQTHLCERCEYPTDIALQHTCGLSNMVGNIGTISSKWSTQRRHLALLHTHGVNIYDIIDSAYLTGLEATRGDVRRKFYQMGYDEAMTECKKSISKEINK